MVVNGWHSDRFGERRWHALLPLAGAGFCFLLVSRCGGHLALIVALSSLSGALFYTYQPVFWTMPTMILCESAAAASFGMINSVGQLGGFAGPYVVSYLNEKTAGLHAAFVFIGVSFLLSAIVLSFIKIQSPTRMRSAQTLEPQTAES